ncbi:recombination-associated protein RdgC [Klebsiella michiganensis]|nr:recombination-associated protein RdgC [Klebsiella michiganensis]
MKQVAFKNVFTYRLSRDIAFNTEDVISGLNNHLFTPCGSQDMAKAGWTETFGDKLVYDANGFLLMTMRREEKILPSTVIKDELAEKIAVLEAEQGRRLKKTEKDSLKDEVLHSLLPRAFTRAKNTRLLIDLKKSLVYVDASCATKAENILALLRKSLGSLPVIPLTAKNPIELTLTDWLTRGFPKGYTPGDTAVLKAMLEDGGAIRCQKQDLETDEVRNHIDAGKVATSIALDWQNRASFRLDDDLSIKRLTFSDELNDQNDDIDREDHALRFDADFLLFTSELSCLITDLVEAIGGESDR